MTPERWHQVTEIFHAARTRTAAERETFLAEVCGGDASLRQDVEAMLAADTGAGSFGGRPLRFSRLIPSWHHVRCVSDRAADWPWRDGRSLSCPRHDPGARCRDQSPARSVAG